MKKQILCMTLLAILLWNTLAVLTPAQQSIRFGKAQPQTQSAQPARGQIAPQSFVGDLVDGIVKIGEDIIAAGASLFEGGNILAGIALVGAQLIIPIPGLQGKAIPVFIAGAAAGKALIKQRHMTPQERDFAQRVFGNSLPPNDKIFLTNLTGLGGREFTIPNGAGQILVNMGSGYDSPLTYTRGSYTVAGQVLIHELTHAWQIYHSKFVPGLVCEGISNQVRNELGESVYNPGVGGRPWNDYNLEQQGSIVDRWFATGMEEDHAFYPYVAINIRGGQFPKRQSAAANSAVSRMSNAMEKFWIEPDGSVQAAYWYEGRNWQRYELAPAGSASATGSLAVVSRIAASMEVFWIGANGSVQAAYWYKSRRWQRYELAPAGSASANGGIAAVSRVPGSMEVFWIGADGSIQDAFWYEGSTWKRFTLAPATSAAVAGNLTVISRVPNSMEVFWIGADGSIQDAFWYEGSTWKRFMLAPAASASVEGSITSSSRVPNSMEVFWIGVDGSIQDAFWYEGSKWSRFALAPAGSASVSGSIAALSRVPNSMEIFWVGRDGSIQDAFWYEGSKWGRFTLAPAGSAALNATLGVVSRVPHSMEIFWDSAGNLIEDAFWYQGSAWRRFTLKSGRDKIYTPLPRPYGRLTDVIRPKS